MDKLFHLAAIFDPFTMTENNPFCKGLGVGVYFNQIKGMFNPDKMSRDTLATICNDREPRPQKDLSNVTSLTTISSAFFIIPNPIKPTGA